MLTPTAATLLNRCVRRPDGLILSQDHRYLADSSGVFRTLVKHGALLKIARGAFVETAKYRTLKDWQRFDLKARAVGATPGRVLAGYSAAAAHGLWRYLAVPPSQAVYRRSRGRNIKTVPGLVQLHAKLPDHHVTTVDAVPVTSIARTVVDLTRLHGFGAGFVAACAALSSGSISTAQIRTCAEGRRYVAPLPLILEKVTPALDSALEAVFLAQTVFFGDFRLIPQVGIHGESGRRYRLDFQVEGTDEFIELDGGGKYGEDERKHKFNLSREKFRSDELARAGISLHRFGYREVMELQAYRTMLRRLGLPPKPHLPRIHLP